MRRHPTAPLADRFGMAYSGTLVVHGAGQGVVVATGGATELGHINRMVGAVASLATPLLRQIARFGRLLAAAILLLAAGTWLLGTAVQGHPPAEMFMMVVGAGGLGDSRGAAGRHDHHAGAGRAAHGPPQGHRAPARRRSRRWARSASSAPTRPARSPATR